MEMGEGDIEVSDGLVGRRQYGELILEVVMAYLLISRGILWIEGRMLKLGLVHNYLGWKNKFDSTPSWD